MREDFLGLWHLATGDPQVVRACGVRTRRLFLLTGVAVGLMCLLTPISLHHLISEAFRSDSMAWAGSILFSIILLNIYRLSLTTVGGDALPNRAARQGKPWTSLFMRVVFLAGFAGFLSAPLSTLLFRGTGEAYVQSRRAQVLDELSALEAAQQGRWALEDKALERSGGTRTSSMLTERGSARLVMEKRRKAIQAERFFIGRIQHTYRTEPMAFILTALLMLLFIAPVLLKRKAYHQPDHMEAMQDLERNLVIEEHALFQEAWRELELEHGFVMARHERYEDPPFNTRPKEREEAESWDSFKTWFKGS